MQPCQCLEAVALAQPSLFRRIAPQPVLPSQRSHQAAMRISSSSSLLSAQRWADRKAACINYKYVVRLSALPVISGSGTNPKMHYFHGPAS